MKNEDGTTTSRAGCGGKRGRSYRAFVLRCWCEEGEAGWRFSIEDIHQRKERRGFSHLEALLEFLRAELGDAPGRHIQDQDLRRGR